MQNDNLVGRLKHAWNVLFNRNPLDPYYSNLGPSSSYKPDRTRRSMDTARSTATPLYNRIAIDVSAIAIRHIRLDLQNDSYLETIDSGLNKCLSLDANTDQTGRSFIQDVVMSMFDEGCVAIVAVDTTIDPAVSSSYDIQSIRTGKIIDWMPQHVRVELYDDRRGIRDSVILPKRDVAIIENPLYAIMNEPNSTLKRLLRKLSLLDSIDEQSGSGKLDLIIQLPYVVRTTLKKKQAEERRQDIEDQLRGSKYGIAYIDGVEKITQLNRPAENNLMTQVEFLTNTLYGQLGLDESIFNGTADEKTMVNYFNRTIEPILAAITDEIKRKFLTKTAISQGQSIGYFKDIFGLSTLADITSSADTLTRNAIVTSNEIRSVIGFRPSGDPEADKLSNKNITPVSSSIPKNPISNSEGVNDPMKGETTK